MEHIYTYTFCKMSKRAGDINIASDIKLQRITNIHNIIKDHQFEQHFSTKALISYPVISSVYPP